MKRYEVEQFGGGESQLRVVSPEAEAKLFMADIAAYDRAEGRSYCGERAEQLVWAAKTLGVLAANCTTVVETSDQQLKRFYRNRLVANVNIIGDEREIAMHGVIEILQQATPNQRLEVLSLFDTPHTVDDTASHAMLFSRAG